jgi:hypothetical protein
MGRFSGRSNFARVQFEPADQAEAPDPDQDNGEGLPAPHLCKVTARRQAGLREAAQALATLPQPGESLHVVSTARHDLTDTLAVLLTRLGRCDRLMIATLGYNEKNLRALLTWLDEVSVKTIGLVTSLFHRAHKRGLFEETIREFHARGQRVAACHSHAKVITLAFSSGARLVIHGSANLCGNGSGREQFSLDNDPGLHDWSAAWIGELLDRHEGREVERRKVDNGGLNGDQEEETRQPPTLF